MRFVSEGHGRARTLAMIGFTLVMVAKPSPSGAQIFKCVDREGHVSYAGRPCPVGTVQAGTFRNARSPSRVADRPPAPGPSGDELDEDELDEDDFDEDAFAHGDQIRERDGRDASQEQEGAGPKHRQ